MKKLINTVILFLTIQVMVSAQCAINYQSVLDKYCNGVYLFHHELSAKATKSLSLILKGKNEYIIYLLNPATSIENIKLTGFCEGKAIDLKSGEYSNSEYIAYTIIPTKTGIYDFSIDFGIEESNCILFAIYYQGEERLKKGFYKNFDELKYNNPTGKFDYEIISNIRKSDKTEILYYNLKTSNKKEQKEIETNYGFCDGKNIFIKAQNQNLFGPVDFLRPEDLGKYYFFEEIEEILVTSGEIIINTSIVRQKIIDKNSGRITLLNKKSLLDLIAEDEVLAEQFKAEKKKETLLKEYLVRFIEKHYKY